jgi:hypothetical protein
LPEVYDRMNFGLIFSWLTASAMPSLLLLAILTTILMAVMTYRESTSAIEDAEKNEETGTTGSRKMTRGIDSSNRKGKQALVSIREAKS